MQGRGNGKGEYVTKGRKGNEVKSRCIVSYERQSKNKITLFIYLICMQKRKPLLIKFGNTGKRSEIERKEKDNDVNNFNQNSFGGMFSGIVAGELNGSYWSDKNPGARRE